MSGVWRAEPETAVVMTTGADWRGTPAAQPEDNQDLEYLGMVCAARWLPILYNFLMINSIYTKLAGTCSRKSVLHVPCLLLRANKTLNSALHKFVTRKIFAFLKLYSELERPHDSL